MCLTQTNTIHKPSRLPLSSVEPRWRRLRSWNWFAGATPSLVWTSKTLIQWHSKVKLINWSGQRAADNTNHLHTPQINVRMKSMNELNKHLPPPAQSKDAHRWKFSANWCPVCHFTLCTSNKLSVTEDSSLLVGWSSKSPPTSKLLTRFKGEVTPETCSCASSTPWWSAGVLHHGQKEGHHDDPAL